MVPVFKRCLEATGQINSKVENYDVTNAIKELLPNVL